MTESELYSVCKRCLRWQNAECITVGIELDMRRTAQPKKNISKLKFVVFFFPFSHEIAVGQ